MHLQRPRESVPTQTLSAGFVTRPARPALAPLQAARAEGAVRAGPLAEASDEARGTLTRPLGRVAGGAVHTPALMAAGRPPVGDVAG